MILAAESAGGQGLIDLFTSQLDVQRVDTAWSQLCTQFPWLVGLVLIVFGLAFLLYGYRVYKALVILVFAGVGGMAGMVVGGYLGLSPVGALVGTVLGALVFGFLAWPLHRIGWGLLGGAASAVVFVGFAGAAGVTTQAYLYVIAGVAFVMGVILTIWLFRPLLITVSSLVGATLLVDGAVRLTVVKPSFGEPIYAFLRENEYVLIIVLLVLAGVGALMQWYDTRGGAAKPRKPGKELAEAKEE
jgi:hypothetical protein